MWGPKKEAELAPPALGEEAPHHHCHHEGWCGDLLSCPGFLPSTQEQVGVSSGTAQPAGHQQVPSLGSVQASQMAAHPREGDWGPTSGIWPFPMQEAPLLPLRVGSHRARPSLNLVLTRNQSPIKASTDIPLYRMGN